VDLKYFREALHAAKMPSINTEGDLPKLRNARTYFASPRDKGIYGDIFTDGNGPPNAYVNVR
jgi:hypothetical protein